jgi:hypothetical protein
MMCVTESDNDFYMCYSELIENSGFDPPTKSYCCTSAISNSLELLWNKAFD